MPPEYRISSREYVYNGGAHYFSLDSLTHPLLEELTVNYEWLKDGECVAIGDALPLRLVADSGKYKCKITVYHGRYSRSAETPEVELKVLKSILVPPSVTDAVYTGEHLRPDIMPSELYTALCEGGTDAGIYPIVLTLRDAENYKWDETDETSVYLDFEIKRAENRFVRELSVRDVYYLDGTTFSASALFGNAVIKYYKSGASTPLPSIPATPGSYYAVASVEGTENYTALSSEPKEFLLLEDLPLGIGLVTPPDKTEYVAFERFSPAGLTVGVNYLSGKTEVVGADRLAISYQSGDCLYAGDNAVFVSYAGSAIAVSVSVSRAEYDLSGLGFGDTSCEYSGAFITPSFDGELPIGLDSIPLSARIEGGGLSAGVYTVRLIFSTDSPNYFVPEPITATLTVTRAAAELVWSGERFIYNEKKQAPTAYFIGKLGQAVFVPVTGGEYDAGSYTATAAPSDNYDFLNPTCEFVIEKATFDLSGAVWSCDTFVYDSGEHSVTVSGLPSGLFASGYADNCKTVVGNYTASVAFSYDEKNYEPPKKLTHQWSITPATYDLSGLEFTDPGAVYDGNIHYPILKGEMPTGLDGIELEYSFSGGVTHVSEGEVTVTVSFATASPNYTAPNPISVKLKISPKPVLITWQGLVFTYDGREHAPTAHSAECFVTVEGSSVGAGKYTARAISLDPDYRVENEYADFVIEKAPNAFVDEPFVKDFFEGHEPELSGAAVFGELEFTFYLDEELEEVAREPLTHGDYFAVARVSEGENYLGISSKPIPFTVIEVVPTELSMAITKDVLTAFERLGAEDIEVLLIYNDGSTEELDISDVKILYQGGDSLRATDSAVTVSYGGFSCAVPVTVSRADYDVSGVRWGALVHVYDGTEKHATLEGLPDGVSLVSIEGDGATSAGEYTLSAVLSYDAVNYNQPHLPSAAMRIERATVPYPTLDAVTYNGLWQTPEYTSALWRIDGDFLARDSGEYVLTAVLTDPENYAFPSGNSSTSVTFTVLPKELFVAVHDVTVYLFEDFAPSGADVFGEVYGGDSLGLVFTAVGDTVTVSALNPNYSLTVEAGLITRSNLPSPRVRVLLFIILLALIILALITVILIRKRDAIDAMVKARATRRRIAKMREAEEVAQNDLPPEDSAPECEHLESFVDPMDADRADSLISNSLARDLVDEGAERIYTVGWRKSVINIDTLNESFEPGARVDVNVLKEMSLVPYDTAYLKVLARGMLDKPLFVYANDFSSTAIKMLALKGGRAVRVSTVKLKKEDGDAPF